VKHAQTSMLAKCSSGLGQFGQTLNPNTARQCSTAQDLSSMGTAAIWVGAILVVVAAGGLIAFFAANAVSAGKKPKVVMPAAGNARSAGPGQGGPARPLVSEGAVLRPVVPSVVGQPAVLGQPVVAGPSAGLPDYPPGRGCGHELANGARFCPVCGRPAAGGRDVFAPEQPVSSSGAEITAVLPVFAPAEPAGLPSPAMAAGRPAERSLAGVTPSPQLGWVDHPPAPGNGDDSGPPWGRADPPQASGGTVSSGPPPPVRADRPPAPEAVVKSGPPWEWAERAPAPGGTGPGADGAGPRPAGRHRSRRS
jgi:hypothetical protein